MHAPRHLNQYDHRLRKLVYDAQDVGIALGLGVPRSTANGWSRQAPPEVITLDVLGVDATELQKEVVKLRNRVAILTAVVALLVTVVRVLGGLSQRRVWDSQKRDLVRAGWFKPRA